MHLHLEGTVSADTLVVLSRKYRIDLGVGSPDELYEFDNLASFLRVYDIVCDAMRSADDFEGATYRALASTSAAGGRYAELFFSPHAHPSTAYPVMLEGISAGINAAKLDFGISARIIPAHNRELGPDAGRAFVAMVAEHRTEYVIGIGLDYMENDPRPFAEMFADARRAGLRVTAHAGEVGPASYVRDSIDVLGCQRIDHGYHVVDDTALMARCQAARTYFTCCPTTTLMTTIWSDPRSPDHAIRQMINAGLIVSINTDDPGLMRTTLTDEYLIVHQMGITLAQLAQIALNGIRMSWMDESEKQATLTEWSRDLDAILR